MSLRDRDMELPPILRDAVKQDRARAPSEKQLASITRSVLDSLERVGHSAGPRSAPEPSKRTPRRAGEIARLGRRIVPVLFVTASLAVGIATWIDDSNEDPRRGQARPPVAEAVSAMALPAHIETPKPSVEHPRVTAPVETPAAELSATRPPQAKPRRLPEPYAPPTHSEPRDDLSLPAVHGELALLSRAKRLMSSSPARSLELVTRHMREHPNGVFGEEREALAVEALLRLGDARSARTRARAFSARFPGSAYARRIDTLLTRAATP